MEITHYPVSAEYSPDGWESNGISFDDYARMSTHTHVLAPARQIEAPAWALNDRPLRQLIVRYTEVRAGFNNPQPGSDAFRLQRAQHFLKNKVRPQQIATLEGLCRKYVALRNQGQLIRQLEIQIENLDTQLCINAKVPALVAGIAYYYYRAGLDCVETGKRLGMKPPHVRMMLNRLRRVWARIPNESWPRPMPETGVDVARVLRLIDEGRTSDEMVAICGCTTYAPILAALKATGCWISRKQKGPSAASAARTIDEVGHVYGKWTVIQRAAGRNAARWICRCTCGKEKTLFGVDLRYGITTQCLSCAAKQRWVARRAIAAAA